MDHRESKQVVVCFFWSGLGLLRMWSTDVAGKEIWICSDECRPKPRLCTHTELKVQIKLQFCEAVVRTLCLKLLPYLVNKNRVHTSTSSPTTLKMRTANITGSETYKGQKDVSVLPPRCHRYIHIHQKLHNMTDSVFYNHIPTLSHPQKMKKWVVGEIFLGSLLICFFVFNIFLHTYNTKDIDLIW